MDNEPSRNELIGAETVRPERARRRHALHPAGRSPELAPRLRTAPAVGARRQRRLVKRCALLLLAAALSIAAVFISGYAAGDHGGINAPTNAVVRTLALRGTSVAPQARARLEIWNSRGGDWPITLSVVGLPKLPPHTYYEVDLVRGGKPWGSVGTFRIARRPRAVTLTLNSPYALRKGDSWVVTRQAFGRETGTTALRPT